MRCVRLCFRGGELRFCGGELRFCGGELRFCGGELRFCGGKIHFRDAEISVLGHWWRIKGFGAPPAVKKLLETACFELNRALDVPPCGRCPALEKMRGNKSTKSIISARQGAWWSGKQWRILCSGALMWVESSGCPGRIYRYSMEKMQVYIKNDWATRKSLDLYRWSIYNKLMGWFYSYNLLHKWKSEI